ncbi:MAG: NYN domain-containing protein [Acidobacteriota bacterium]|nr:NYN domain-containing protein [Acidobacteriota bacterium]
MAPSSADAQASSSDGEPTEVTAASLFDMTDVASDEAQDPKEDEASAPTILEEKVLEEEEKKRNKAAKPRARRSTTRAAQAGSDDDKPKRAPRTRKTAARKSTAKKTAAKKATPAREGASRKTTRAQDSDTVQDAAPRSRGRSRAKAPAPVAPEIMEPTPVAQPVASDPMSQLAEILREVVSSGPDRTETVVHERRIALFCDLENVALGVRDSDEVDKFDIDLVLERLLEKGKIIVKKAYADWQRYAEFKRPLHTAGIELIDIPQKYYSGKNSADIKMVVDALDVAYSKEHLDTIVLLSGDSDFTPLVSKLKENNKHVIAIGVKNSSSKLLVDNCDEFIYYEDIWRGSRSMPQLEGLDEKTAEAFALMNDAIQALQRENKTVLWGSMIKQTMQRKRPSFNEGYYGYSSFSNLLEDAEKKKLINLRKDGRSGSYVVTVSNGH